ncbi:2671_t:CDS:10 [Funneliformis mosseae]|uniref:Nuclear protein localization protein 4 n=1 Tax=Funneliformis mosseae TaxID=27381 RepID=A0A9N9DZT4_FUNMO|nr:2671_t:CDS:10 [Funneliformis mosseae]
MVVMLVRIRSKEGTFRLEVDPNESIISLGTKIANQLKLTEYSSLAISDNPTSTVPITELTGKTISELRINHGDLLYVTFVQPTPETDGSNTMQTESVVTKTTTPAPLNVKQDPVDDLLDKQDGLIKRNKDPKFCKHAANGMCDYCMPLEPYDKSYLAEKGIKHISFHAYLKSVNKSNKQSNGKFIPPLEEQDFQVKAHCLGGHAPWPEGICTKCQPSAVTLALQQYRMVDHVEFSVPTLVENFIRFWRNTGLQRFGYLYGRYEPHPEVPLGVKAVVEAIYEPPQVDEVDGLTLTLPWNDEQLVDEVAAACGLVKVGMIYTDLTDDGTGQGKVIYKRHIDSYFLSSQECCFTAAMQNKNPLFTKWSASGKFGSRFITCVVSGNEDGGIYVNAYQVSNTCASMVSADIIEASVEPGIMRVKESTSERYVSEVFYKYKNEYGVNVQESAKPCFPVDYLLVKVTDGFPSNPTPLFTSEDQFPIANRHGSFPAQDYTTLFRHLGLKDSGNVHVNSVSDFQLLTFVKGTQTLDEDEFSALARLATSHEEKDANQLAQSSGWQTLVAIMRENDHSPIPNGRNLGRQESDIGIGGSRSSSIWACRHCTFVNQSSISSCEICGLPKD